MATPPFRRATKDELKASPELDRPSLLGAVAALWARPVFELRAAAIETLRMKGPLQEAPRYLPPADRDALLAARGTDLSHRALPTAQE